MFRMYPFSTLIVKGRLVDFSSKKTSRGSVFCLDFPSIFVESIFNHFFQTEWIVIGGKMDSPKFHDIFQKQINFASLTNGNISSSNNSDSVKNKPFFY